MIIETEKQYSVALEKMEELLLVTDDSMKNDHPDVLLLNMIADQIDLYEKENNHKVAEPSLIEYIEYKLVALNINRKEASNLLGVSASRFSDFMNGKKKLTINFAKSLHSKLGISYEIIMQ